MCPQRRPRHPLHLPARRRQHRFPWFGLPAVLLGTFISTLNTRLSTLGLADIRGAVHAGFRRRRVDLDGPDSRPDVGHPRGDLAGCDLWHAPGVDGSRRGFAVISLLEPFSPNLPTLLVFQFLGGLATGFFIPLTLSFVLRNTPPKAWAYGIAVYALNLEVSLNISASLEGWYTDHLSWRFIFWQNVPFAVVMFACLFLGVKPEPANPHPAARRTVWIHLRGLRLRADLCRARPGQPAGLAQLAAGHRAVGGRVPAVDCLLRPRVELPLPG